MACQWRERVGVTSLPMEKVGEAALRVEGAVDGLPVESVVMACQWKELLMACQSSCLVCL